MRRLLPLTVCATLFLSACGFQQPEPTSPATPRDLDVSIDLSSRHRCSRISPEINITGLPQDVEVLEVILEDTADSKRMHGGGTHEHDGESTASIPEGALTRYYSGPCPSVADNGRIYQYVVKALDVNKRMVGIGTYAFEQE